MLGQLLWPPGEGISVPVSAEVLDGTVQLCGLPSSFLPGNVAFPLAAAFLTQTVCLDDTTVKFEIWDTAGQERYHSLAPMYYRGAQAAIVVYDITNQVSGLRRLSLLLFIGIKLGGGEKTGS